MSKSLNGARPTLTRPTIGVVAICKDEARDLPGFLANLLPWVDEIILVDDGSTDATAAIASGAGRKVTFIDSPRSAGEYFSGQRNKGIDAASADWLIHMDIDERVTPELASEIQAAINETRFDAYRYRRLNYFLHRKRKDDSWNPWKLRLVRREVFRFGGKMHETDEVTVGSERIGRLNSFMWHLNDDTYRERLRKSALYTEIEAENILESGLKVGWQHFLVEPLKRGLYAYFKQGGYKDGTLGLLHALHTFSSTFQWYAFAWEAQNHIDRETIEAELDAAWQRERVQND